MEYSSLSAPLLEMFSKKKFFQCFVTTSKGSFRLPKFRFYAAIDVNDIHDLTE
jgi:hypothetical protein